MPYIVEVVLREDYGVEENIEHVDGVDKDFYISRGRIRVEVVIAPMGNRRCWVRIILSDRTDKYLVDLTRRFASMYTMTVGVRLRTGYYPITLQLIDFANTLLKPLSATIGEEFNLAYTYREDGVIVIAGLLGKQGGIHG